MRGCLLFAVLVAQDRTGTVSQRQFEWLLRPLAVPLQSDKNTPCNKFSTRNRLHSKISSSQLQAGSNLPAVEAVSREDLDHMWSTFAKRADGDIEYEDFYSSPSKKAAETCVGVTVF